MWRFFRVIPQAVYCRGSQCFLSVSALCGLLCPPRGAGLCLAILYMCLPALDCRVRLFVSQLWTAVSAMWGRSSAALLAGSL